MTRKSGIGATVRAAIYLRCSSDDQKEGDFSTIDVQRDLNQTLIAERGWTVAGIYSDEGRTGTNLNRPGWKQLLADARQHKFSVVVCTYMSRLGRGRAFVIAEYELNNTGVKVELAREKFTNDLAGYVNRSMTNVWPASPLPDTVSSKPGRYTVLIPGEELCPVASIRVS